MQIKVWACRNCGHEELIQPGDELKELGFTAYSALTSRISCPACRAYTIQRAYDETFTAGYFLVVKPKNDIRGKG